MASGYHSKDVITTAYGVKNPKVFSFAGHFRPISRGSLGCGRKGMDHGRPLVRIGNDGLAFYAVSQGLFACWRGSNKLVALCTEGGFMGTTTQYLSGPQDQRPPRRWQRPKECSCRYWSWESSIANRCPDRIALMEAQKSILVSIIGAGRRHYYTKEIRIGVNNGKCSEEYLHRHCSGSATTLSHKP